MPVITDVEAALSRPGFWSAYYGGRIADTDDEDAAPFLARVLGSDPDFDDEWLWGPDPYDAVDDGMDDEEEDRAMKAAMAAGAVLDLPFPSGHTWSIRFSSAPGVYHSLSGPDGADRISLGYDDPHFHLPILRWPEAWLVAAHLGRHPGTTGPAPFPARFALPLLAPVTWATSLEEAAEAKRLLAEAWTATGMVKPDHAVALADRLVLTIPDLIWEPDPIHGWTNNGPHSHRNPAAGPWSPEGFAVFRGFLDSLGAGDRPAPTTTMDAGAAVRWRFDAGGPVEPTVTVTGGQVYCVTSGNPRLLALDAATGQRHWRSGVAPRGFGRNAVTVVDDVVHYAGGVESLDLVAFGEHASGEVDVNWVHPLDPDGMRFTASGAYCGWADTTPVVAGGRVFVAEERLFMRPLSPAGPGPGWDAHLGGLYTPRSRPVVVGDRVYVAVAQNYDDISTVEAFDVATGESAGEQGEVAGTVQDLVADGGDLFLAAGTLTVLDAATGAMRWSVETERQWSGAIAVTGDRVVGTTCRPRSASTAADSGWRYTMVGIDRHRAEVAWTVEVPGRLCSRGVVVNGRMAYSVGYDEHDATLYAVDVTTGTLRWQHALGRSTCLPAAADGTVYVSTADGALLALGGPVGQ